MRAAGTVLTLSCSVVVILGCGLAMAQDRPALPYPPLVILTQAPVPEDSPGRTAVRIAPRARVTDRFPMAIVEQDPAAFPMVIARVNPRAYPIRVAVPEGAQPQPARAAPLRPAPPLPAP